MKNLYNIKIFSFTYNSIVDKNPRSSYNIKEFWLKQFIVSKSSTHAINFRSKDKLHNTFNYNFYLFSIYLVDEDLLISIFTKQK